MEDGDFLDVDWSKKGSDRLVILLHGLEGDSHRPYIKGMVKSMNKESWDTLSVNFRGCSGENNRTPRAYHSGETDDLKFLITKAIKEHQYKHIHLVGFSLGGNVVLKYAGQYHNDLPEEVCSVTGISVPCELGDSAIEISKPSNKIYLKRFLRTLKLKVKEKEVLTEDKVDIKKVLKSKDFFEFDDLYTAPVHGFTSGKEYWYLSSANRFLKNINIPCLIINALDDTFLANSCYPFELARNHPYIHLETPKYGGHVGFTTFGKEGTFWTESRTIKFIYDSFQKPLK